MGYTNSRRSAKGAGRKPRNLATEADLTNGVRPGTSVRDYAVLNLIFFLICIAHLVIVRILLPDFAGLYFFFGFLVVAFFIVSVFDYVSSHMTTHISAEDNDAIIDG